MGRNFILLFSFLLPSVLFSQPTTDTPCNFSAFDPGEHAFWIDQLPNGPGKKYVFDQNGATFLKMSDGRAQLSGVIVNTKNSSWTWQVNIFFQNEQDWLTWSSKGRTYKSSPPTDAVASENHQDWIFWELDEGASLILGIPGTPTAGKQLELKPRPTDYSYGFQMGLGANDFNGSFGLSGWFFYEYSENGVKKAQGNADINGNLNCPEVKPCISPIIQTEAVCLDDGSFEVQVQIEGSGTAYNISDDQGTSILENVGPGSYTFGKYTNETRPILTVSENNSDCQTTQQIQASCKPLKECSLGGVTVSTNCIDDQSFLARVEFQGEGQNYSLADDNGNTLLSNLVDGAYYVGPFTSGSRVEIFVIDNDLDDCIVSTGIFLDSCEAPGPACQVQQVSSSTQCITDSTFKITITFAGIGDNFQIQDDQGSTPLSGLSPGTYTLGEYLQGTLVDISLGDPNFPELNVVFDDISASCSSGNGEGSCPDTELTATTACNEDGTFSAIITVVGNGDFYSLGDDLGSLPLNNLAAGTYTFGKYVSEEQVNISLVDFGEENCVKFVTGLTASCEDNACTLDSVFATSICNPDGTFSLSISFSGEGNAFSILDNQGTTPFSNVSAGTYTYGLYESGTEVSIIIADESQTNCFAELTGLTETCEKQPICDLGNVSTVAICNPDGTFRIQVTFSGTDTAYVITDDKGTPSRGGIIGGSFFYGNYPNGEEVAITVSHSEIPECTVTVPGIRVTCTEPTCDLANLEVSPICAEDGTFSVNVSFEGSGNNFTISDDQATAPLAAISAGVYNYGKYQSKTPVAIVVTHTLLDDCFLIKNNITANCEVPVCDIDITRISSECSSDSTFALTMTFTGSGSSYSISDNQGNSLLSGVSPGTYVFDNYASETLVRIGIFDESLPSCVTVSDLVTGQCKPLAPENDLCSNAIPIACNTLTTGTTRGSSEDDVCAYCGTTAEGPGVWYSLLGSGEDVQIKVCGDYDTRLGVFEFGCDTLACVVGNDDNGEANCSEVFFSTVPGRTYYIYINGTSGQSGEFSMEVNCTTANFGELSNSGEHASHALNDLVHVENMVPNPTRGSSSLKVFAENPGTLSWKLVTIRGLVVERGNYDITVGVNKLPFDLGSQPEGIYFVELWIGAKKLSTQKVIKVD